MFKAGDIVFRSQHYDHPRWRGINNTPAYFTVERVIWDTLILKNNPNEFFSENFSLYNPVARPLEDYL